MLQIQLKFHDKYQKYHIPGTSNSRCIFIINITGCPTSRTSGPGPLAWQLLPESSGLGCHTKLFSFFWLFSLFFFPHLHVVFLLTILTNFPDSFADDNTYFFQNIANFMLYKQNHFFSRTGCLQCLGSLQMWPRKSPAVFNLHPK